MAEARATPSDSEDSTEWRSMTPEEIAIHVKGANRKRRNTENSMKAGRSWVEADNDNVGYAEYHTASAEEEAIRTGAFLPTDSQKELAYADAESLMSPPAHIQTQREDGFRRERHLRLQWSPANILERFFWRDFSGEIFLE